MLFLSKTEIRGVTTLDLKTAALGLLLCWTFFSCSGFEHVGHGGAYVPASVLSADLARSDSWRALFALLRAL